MALLEILHYPDPRLRKKARPVTHFDDALRKLVADMLETMYRAPGIGLAAPQINVAQRVVVIDISRENSTPRVFINPEIIKYSIGMSFLRTKYFHDNVNRLK